MSKKSIQYSETILKKFNTIISEKLKKTQAELATIEGDQKSQKYNVANSDVDFNENSKHFQQQAKNKQHIRRLQRKARALNGALNRIEDKTYGISERTGKLIREARLMAMPTARFDILPK